jgi:tRNA (guanine6-N2)-methyltransferase
LGVERYFARVTRGLEYVSNIEISRIPGVRVEGVDYRRIDFAYAHNPHRLLGLCSVDDVYVFAGRLDGIGHRRDALPEITRFVRELALETRLSVCQTVRYIPADPTYTVTASLRGKRNYSRFDVAAAVRQGVDERYTWSYVDTAESTESSDLDLRVVVEDEFCLVGFRLAENPLHRRLYKQDSLPGALKAPVAYSLCLLARPSPGSVLLDSLGGVGTIVIEAGKGFDVRRAILGENDPLAAQMARQNAARARTSADILVADAARFPLANGSLDTFVSDFPWGRQVPVQETTPVMYHAVVSEIQRLLKPEGCAVILTEQTESMMQALEQLPDLNLVLTRQISLFGRHPTVFILAKESGCKQYLAEALQDTSWKVFIRDALEQGQSHPDSQVSAHAVQAWHELSADLLE